MSRLLAVVPFALERARQRQAHGLPARGVALAQQQVWSLWEAVREYALCGLDWAGRVTHWNTGARLMLGFEAAEILGRHFSCFYPARLAVDGGPERALAHAAAEGGFQEESLWLRKGGKPFWARLELRPVADLPGTGRGFSLVVQDITVRQEAAAAREWQLQTLQARLPRLNGGEGHAVICSGCGRVRREGEPWQPLELYLREHPEAALFNGCREGRGRPARGESLAVSARCETAQRET